MAAVEDSKSCTNCEHYRQDLEDAWCQSPTHYVPATGWVSLALCGETLPGWEVRVG